MSEPFDPDAYLRKKLGAGDKVAEGGLSSLIVPGFDPDAYLARKQPQVGQGKAGVLGFAQGGTLGFADEIGGGLAKLLPTWLGGVKESEVRGEGLPEQPSSYELTRDLVREEAEAARKQNPKTYLAGEIAGALATTPLVPGGGAAQGAGFGARAASAAKTGAGLGAAFGAGSSEADLLKGEAVDLLLDTARGGAIGAVAGAGGEALRSAAAPVVRRAGDWLRQVGINQGRKALLPGGTDSLSARKALGEDAVEEALRSGGIRFLGSTEGAAKRLAGLSDAQRTAYNKLLTDLEAAGVQGPEAGTIARTLRQRAAEEATAAPAGARVPKAFSREAENIEVLAGAPKKMHAGHGAKPPPEDFVSKAFPKPEGPSTRRLGLQQAEGLKRNLQREGTRYGRLGDTPMSKAREEIASIVREANEQAVEAAGQAAPAGSQVGQLAGEFVPAKQRLARLIEASKAAERGAARTAQSSGSMPGAIEITGALASGSPAPLMGGMLRSVARNRLPSTIGSAAYGAGTGLSRLASGARVPELSGATSRAALMAGELLRDSPSLRVDDPQVQAIIDALLGRR